MSNKVFTIIYASVYGANVKHYFKEEAVKIVARNIDDSRLVEAARFFVDCDPGDELTVNHEILIFCNANTTLKPHSFVNP